MHALTVSDDFEIVIPREVTETLHLRPGEQVDVREDGGQIRLVRLMSFDEARGMLGPTDLVFTREPDREF